MRRVAASKTGKSGPIEFPAIPNRLEFKIGEVSRLVGVKDYVLRFWENEFEGVRPRKGRNGHRIYTRADVELLRDIRLLLHGRRLTIAGARVALRDGKDAVALAKGESSGSDQVVPVAAQRALADARAALETERMERQRLADALVRAREEASAWRTQALGAQRRLESVIARLRSGVLAVRESIKTPATRSDGGDSRGNTDAQPQQTGSKRPPFDDSAVFDEEMGAALKPGGTERVERVVSTKVVRGPLTKRGSGQ